MVSAAGWPRIVLYGRGAYPVGEASVGDDLRTTRTPFGINVAAGAVAMVVATVFAAAAFPDAPARLAVMA
jgi:hypothetical protein